MTTEIKVLILGLLGTAIMIAGAVFLIQQAEPQSTDNTDLEGLVGPDPHVLGATSAEKPVVLVEFSDFQCPACRASQPTLRQLKEQYEDKVKLVFRHFPLEQLHANARLAAQASEAAANQGKFWQMHDLLFERQTEWSESSVEQARAQFTEYAQGIGLDTDSFQADLDAEKTRQAVDEDLQEARKLGLNATPSFFLNSELISPGVSFDEWQKRIERLL